MNKGLCSEFITYNDVLYQVYRKVSKIYVDENQVGDIRVMWNCDKVLKTKTQDDEIYLFLIECPDAVIVENPPPEKD